MHIHKKNRLIQLILVSPLRDQYRLFNTSCFVPNMQIAMIKNPFNITCDTGDL